MAGPYPNNQGVDGGALPVRVVNLAQQFVPAVATAAGIQAAHDAALSAGGGYVALKPGVHYTIDQPVTFEASRVGLLGNMATLNDAPLASTATASLLLTSTLGDYPAIPQFSDFSIIGDSTIARDSLQAAIRCHTVTANSDVRVVLHNIRAQYHNANLSIGSGAFLTRGFGLELSRSKFGIIQEAGATNFAEDCVFWANTIFDNDCHVKLAAGQRIKFYGTSFDYFGSKDGVRQTADDMAFYLSNGAHLSLKDCHVEFNYGNYAGQTNNPILLNSTGDMFFMENGILYYAGANQNPYWSAPLKTAQNFQRARLKNVGMKGLGRVGAATADDAFSIGSETTNQAGSGGLVQMDDCYSPNNTLADLPSIVSYRSQSQWTRNGVDNPYLELSYKIALTGTAAIANVATDGAVNPRNAVGNMIKITGQGLIRIPIPITLGSQKLYPWSLFLNALNVTGAVTIKENYTTYAMKADGTFSADTRGAQASAVTKAITGVGANAWNRYSWKDVRSDTNNSPRITYNAFFFIEIDTTGMTAGSIDLDDFAYTAG
jgi:hypothetical protein